MHMIFPFYTFNCHAGIKYKPYPEYLPIYPHFRLFNPSKSHCLMLNSPCSLARSPCLMDKSLYPHQIPHFVQTFPHIIPQSLIQRVPMMWRFPTRRWFLGVFNMNGGRDEWWYWRNFAKKNFEYPKLSPHQNPIPNFCTGAIAGSQPGLRCRTTRRREMPELYRLNKVDFPWVNQGKWFLRNKCAFYKQ